MDGQRITLSIDAQPGSSHRSPDRIRLGELSRFTEDVRVLLNGDGKEIDANEIEVSVVKGSYAYQTYPLPPAPKLFSDLESLANGEIIGAIDEKRKAVIERWQKLAKSVGGYIFKISAPFLKKNIIVSELSNFHSIQLEHWVNVERYINGEIQDLGGSTKSNVHVKLPDGKILTVQTDKSLLRDEQVNRLYKKTIIRVTAEFNLSSRELRNAKLIEFVDYKTEVDEEAIERMKKRGAEAWEKVGNASAWVEALRGNKN